MFDENFGNKKIMIVDDEPEIVKITTIALELENYSVTTAYSGEECFDKLELNENPDLILLDIMMSGINGYDLYKKIRKTINLKI